MARSYANLDPNALGPTLELEQGNLVVRSNRDATDIHRCVRGTIGVSSGIHAFEVGFWGDGALDDHASVGIVTGSHKLSFYVGEGAAGYGWRVGDDGVYNNNSKVLTLDATDKKRFIAVRVDLDASQPTCTFLVDGTPRGTVDIDAGKTWYPAVTVSGDTAYDLAAFINCGQRAPGYPVKNFGWFTEPDPIDPLYFVTTENPSYLSKSTDTPARQLFLPVITNGDQIAFANKNDVWTQSDRGSSGSSYASIDIKNDRGRFDYLLGRDIRNTPVRFTMVRKGAALATGTRIATAIIDRFDAVGELSIRATLRGNLTKLEEPLQQKLFPPWADEGVANRPMPISIGALRNVEGMLEDAVALRYVFHDAPISNFAIARDMGAPLDPYSTPPQYTPTNDARGLILETNPVGLLTSDIDNVGEQYLIPGANDVLGGAGLFTTWPLAAPNPPTGWEFEGGAGNSIAKQGVANGFEQNYVATISTSKSWNPDGTAFGVYMRTSTAVLLPTRTYRIQVELARTSGNVPTPTVGAIEFGFMLRSDRSNNASGAITPHNQPLQAAQFGTIGNVYTFTHTVPPGAARKLHAIVAASQNTDPNTGFGTGTATFYNIKAELLGQIEQTRPLQAMKLADALTEIFEKRGTPMDSSEWSRADAELIDEETGYPGIGLHIREPYTKRRAAEELMPSYCATLIEYRDGTIGVRRLTDPSTADESEIVYEFDGSNMKFGIQPRTDVAPNLTTSAGVRRNWRVFTEPDFVTDELVMPAATKTQFKRQSQLIVSSSVSLADTYRAALNRSPIHFLFDDEDVGQTEIDRVNGFYRANRYPSGAKSGTPAVGRFLTLTAIYDDGIPPALYFNDKVRITHERFGLSAGKVFCVWSTEYRPTIGIFILDVWSPE